MKTKDYRVLIHNIISVIALSTYEVANDIFQNIQYGIKQIKKQVNVKKYACIDFVCLVFGGMFIFDSTKYFQ